MLSPHPSSVACARSEQPHAPHLQVHPVHPVSEMELWPSFPLYDAGSIADARPETAETSLISDAQVPIIHSHASTALISAPRHDD